jgi:hypothetical protein
MGGVQALDDRVLKELGRQHTAGEAIDELIDRLDRIDAPVAPTGWPSEMPLPLGSTFAASKPPPHRPARRRLHSPKQIDSVMQRLLEGKSGIMTFGVETTHQMTPAPPSTARI